MRRAVFLDRDGVINRAFTRQGKPFPPATLQDLEILPGVADALTTLRAAGFLNVVVTNQPDVATGEQRRDVVDAMHAFLLTQLPIDAIKTCFHVEADRCDCRKPKPGMLTEAAREFGIDLSRSFLVGDRWRDVSAGKAVGCYTYFIDCGYSEALRDAPDRVVASLEEASRHMLQSAVQREHSRGS